METLRFRILPLVQVSPDLTPVNVLQIQSLCEKGLDECPPEDRAAAWLVLSGTLPPHPEEWPSLRVSRRIEYHSFVSEFSISEYEKKILPDCTEGCDFGVPDRPLMDIIHGDVIRTSHHLAFLPNPDTDVEISGEESDQYLRPFHTQMRRIERILYVFACVNPTLSYLQGFNELVCVLFYAYSCAIAFFNRDYDEVEAFVFYTFQQMISVTKLQELFTTQDKSSLIHRRLAVFMEILRVHLPGDAKIITGFDIHPLCFCFRWLNLLFAQEHMMPNLVLIWDALFAHFDEFIEYASYLAVAHIKMIEKFLKADDYLATLTALQRTNVNDVKQLLAWGSTFWAKDHKEAKRPSLGGLLKKFVVGEK
jgi:hypothetical protein